MKKWEEDIQRALERREKKMPTVRDLEDARTFAGQDARRAGKGAQKRSHWAGFVHGSDAAT